jgi:ketosteroid isomerase-like protein
MTADPVPTDIRHACEQVAVGYAKASDKGDADAAAAHFVEDGLLEMPGGRSYAGRDAIRQRLADQPAGQVSRHLLSNFSARVVSPGRVTGHCVVTLYRATRTATGPLPLAGPYLVGEYDDEYHSTPEGWRLARRKLTTVFRRQDD